MGLHTSRGAEFPVEGYVIVTRIAVLRL